MRAECSRSVAETRRRQLAALLRSAEISRSQHAAIELGRTLLVLADVARRADHLTLAREADAERAAIVERIGPQARGLAWAEDIAAAPGIARRSSAPIAGSLSPREREIATLIADGLSNHEIAEALVITERTAANHIQHILNKLGFHSRAQIAAWVVERSIGTQA